MACKYCYLEDNTKDEFKKMKPLDTLEYAINKFKEQNVIPFNISLHGGEVTTLSHSDFYDLIKFINDYYEKNKELISAAGFKVSKPHIKTNLYGIVSVATPVSALNIADTATLLAGIINV